MSGDLDTNRRWAMRGSIYAELAGMGDGVAEFRRACDQLHQTLTELDSELSRSLAEWTGDAAAAYGAAHREWSAAARDMVDQLTWLRTVIATARDNYGSARSAGLRMWGR
jgi:WXG100 family type VII secretion target